MDCRTHTHTHTQPPHSTAQQQSSRGDLAARVLLAEATSTTGYLLGVGGCELGHFCSVKLHHALKHHAANVPLGGRGGRGSVIVLATYMHVRTVESP